MGSSITTTSGLRSLTRATASRPLLPTRPPRGPYSHPPAPGAPRAPACDRLPTPPLPPSFLRSGSGKANVQSGPLPRGRLDLQLPSEQGHPLTHAAQAQPLRLLRRGQRQLDVEARAVVLDDGLHVAIAFLENDAHARRVGVLRHVGERFLHHPVERRLHTYAQPDVSALRIQITLVEASPKSRKRSSLSRSASSACFREVMST